METHKSGLSQNVDIHKSPIIVESISLTASVVIYHTPPAQLRALLESLRIAIAAVPERVVARVVIINNGPDLQKQPQQKQDTHTLHPLQDLNPQQNQLAQKQQQLDTHALAHMKSQLAAAGIETQFVQGHGNIGYGRGQNLAIGASLDRYHLILNPDVELAPDALKAGLAYLEDHPDTDMVCPAAVNSAGEALHLCKREPSVLTLFLRGFGPAWLKAGFRRRLARYEMADLPADQPASGVPHASGCCMLCRGDRLRALGGFDERYFLYFEDFDLSRRFEAAITHLPNMRIVHHGGHSAGKGFTHIRAFVLSAWRYFNQYGWRWL